MRERVLERFPDARVEVEGEGCNFRLSVHTEEFRALSRLQRQKLLYGLFSEEIGRGDIHALTLQTGLPAGPASRQSG